MGVHVATDPSPAVGGASMPQESRLTEEALVMPFIAMCGCVIVGLLFLSGRVSCRDDCADRGGVWVSGATGWPVCVPEAR